MYTSIPDSTLERFTTFGDLLRFLRRRAGLTQLELSIAVGYSDAQISRLEQNLRLPDIPTIEARFIPALGLEDESRAVVRLLDLAANVRREDAPSLGICPYKGLNFFDEADADLFAGREALTAQLVERVLSLASKGESADERFLAVVGASGSGKSSLVRAGLVPALRWNPDSAYWPVHVLTPTAHPLESLAASLTQGADSVAATAALMDDLAREQRSLKLFIKRALQKGDATRYLLVVDQFEELFTLCRSEEERAAFINNLLTAAGEADSPAMVLIALRADFYNHCAGYPQLRAALASHQEFIGAMSAAEMRRAIEEPASRGRWEFEPGLVDLLLHDVGAYAGHTVEPGALPLLSHALFETWQRRRGRLMTLSGYSASGGVRGAIAETAEAVFADQFSPGEQAIARRIFLRLTELGEETATSDTRRRATYGELILKPEEEAATLVVIKALADARLITTEEDSVEVAHEALIREWPTLRAWLEEDRESLRLHRHLTGSAGEWLSADRDPDLLYRGARLAQAVEWAGSNRDELNPLEREFLAASQAWAEREASEREQQRQRELDAAQKLAVAESQRAEQQAQAAFLLRRRALYLAAAFFVAIGMAFAALFFGGQARQAAQAAQEQQRISIARELAASAIGNLDTDPELSILLALQAVNTTYDVDQTWTAEAEDSLRRALQTSRLELTLQGHTSQVWDVAFSPDGSRLATSSDDGTARVWDTLTGETQLILPTGNTHGHAGIAFSPDGSVLATASRVGEAKVWDASTGQEMLTLNGHSDWVTGVAFSPDGKLLATASEDRTVKIWDAATGQEQLSLIGHTADIWGIAFSPDGQQIATASNDGSARIWEASTGKLQFTLTNQSEPVIRVTYSPDGTRLATGSVDRTAKIWDAATGELLLVLRGHTAEVVDVAFSLDGARLATAGVDGKARVWDTATGQELLTLSGHKDQVAAVAFSPDCLYAPGSVPEQCGTRLATASWDGTAKVWNASFNQELYSVLIPGLSVGAINPEGTLLASGDLDGRVKLWDISTALQEAARGEFASATVPARRLDIPAHSGAVNDIAFSPDGRLLATTSEDKTAKVWDLATGSDRLTLVGHTAAVVLVAFSPDGTRLATAGNNYGIKVWDLNTGQSFLTLYTGGLFSPAIALSPGESRLAAGLTDGTAKVWDVASDEELLTLRGHAEGIYGIAYSPDGAHLATASDDGTARLWDAASGREQFTLAGHTGRVNDVAFSPDGLLLATAGQDGTARVWETETGNLVLALPGHADPLVNVVFVSDGKWLVTRSLSGMYSFYALDIEDLLVLSRNRVTRPFTPSECQQYLHLPPGQCPQSEETTAQTEPVVRTAPPVIPQTLTAKGKVCEITDMTGVDDQFFNQIAYQGLLEAAKRYGWEATALEPQQPSDIQKKLSEFLQSNCDLIVAPAALTFHDLFFSTAEANPDQKFQIFDWGFEPLLDNVWAQVYAVDQAGFLAGYVAASVSRTGKVGTYGGINIGPVVTGFMDGFALGVDYFNKTNGAKVEMVGWDVESQDGLFTGNFENTNDGRQMAERLMDEGVDIILPVAGNVGLGTAAAVQERGDAYIIGVDSDWVVTYPEYRDIILTSIEKRLDISVLSAVEAIVNGTFTGGVHLGTLENGGVSLAPFHDLDALVSPQVKADLEQIKAGIIAGKIKTNPRQ